MKCFIERWIPALHTTWRARLKCGVRAFAGMTTLNFLSPSILFACPLCEEAIAKTRGGLAKGFYWSVLLMIGMPLVVIAVIAGFFIRSLPGSERGSGRKGF